MATHDGWRPWRCGIDAPLPAPTGESCAWSRTHWGPMCLKKNELISDSVRSHGRWRECDKLVRMFTSRVKFAGQWNASDATHRLDESRTFLELGANIGSCTVALLLANATIFAFEPSPVNLFYLTSTLDAAVRERPDLAGRATIYPLGAGDSSASLRFNVPLNNLGHSAIKAQNAASSPRDYTILVRPLDDVLPADLNVTLMKVDVEGYECHAIRGLERLLRRGAVAFAAVEFAERGLRVQGCTSKRLAALLTEYGFPLAPTLPKCAQSWFPAGCDLMAAFGTPTRTCSSFKIVETFKPHGEKYFHCANASPFG